MVYYSGASAGDSGGVLWRIFAVSCDRHGGAGGTFAGSLPERGDYVCVCSAVWV